MIYATGDTHGSFVRFDPGIFPEQQEMCKDDYVIICGDFGGVWDGSEEENKKLDLLNTKPFTTLFIDGNHENFDLLKNYPTKEWNGGNARFIRDSIIHLLRGQIYMIDGKSLFTMGGASSHDISAGILEVNDPKFEKKRERLEWRDALYRINHVSWWKEELPNNEEYEIAITNLEQNNWIVDFIFTHSCPKSIVRTVGNRTHKKDKLTKFFETVKKRCEFKKWYFGHYHSREVVQDKFFALYGQIVEVR